MKVHLWYVYREWDTSWLEVAGVAVFAVAVVVVTSCAYAQGVK